MKIYSSRKRFFVFALSCLVSIASRTEARIIMVTGKPPATLETLRAAARELKDPPFSKTPAPALSSLEYKILESREISADLSVPAGRCAYFWSDQPVSFQPGFKAEGHPVFFERESDGALKKPALPFEKSPPAAFSISTRREGRGLRVDYVLPEAGSLQVELFDARGKSRGTWIWKNDPPGVHSRVLEIKGFPSSGILYMTSRQNGQVHRSRILIGK